MKIQILIITILLTGIAAAKPFSSIGIHFGLNSTYQNWEYDNSKDLSVLEDIDLHYSGAVTVEMFEQKYLSFLFGIAYLQKGGLDKNVKELSFVNGVFVETGTIDVWNRLDYLCFSPAIKVKYGFNKFEPYIFAGPSFDLLINTDDNGFYDMMSEFKNYEISLPFGAGVSYTFGKQFNLDLNVQYQPTLTSSFKNEHLTVTNYLFKYNVGILLLL